MLDGQSTDAGGGGTGESFKAELEKLGRVLIDEARAYLSSTCALHAHNLTLKKTVKILMGEGGLESRNALQLLHSCYNLQSGGGGGLEYEEFQNLYEEATGEKWTKITCPVMTRLEHCRITSKGCDRKMGKYSKI